ncbi:hypothetical protein SY83_14665 [Paenibacillus swuensis]|uniref:MYXO-CTERM domain-containing protein n=1 Tax=Paenibacillus swuensis TaxID=1178515 RepID=A0A172TKK8_9BACL|nr:hypothetical protein [Paenibacillus swuensis]ANE47303.1 hypothetical protein SY83_14665 [Paenibacillus swuensis]
MNKQAAALLLTAGIALSLGVNVQAAGNTGGTNPKTFAKDGEGFKTYSGTSAYEQSFQNSMGIRGATSHNGTGFGSLESAGANYSQAGMTGSGQGNGNGMTGRGNGNGMLGNGTNNLYNMGSGAAGMMTRSGRNAMDHTMNGAQYNGAGIGGFDGTSNYNATSNGPTAPNFMGTSRSPYYGGTAANNANGNNQVRGNNLYQMNTYNAKAADTTQNDYGWLGWFGLLGMFGLAGVNPPKRRS